MAARFGDSAAPKTGHKLFKRLDPYFADEPEKADAPASGRLRLRGGTRRLAVFGAAILGD